ncbi:hypothetical protein DFP72DRAFT_335465 [Ephemerocybe angulata]|uniref:Uncharacterized protein n=1 Tax=Ephemerocybe angulata TaxID=980116 RepID=A0A8H6IIQ6_9AGAR|nr:hypothetical protein DFP72DRAFT_335465 [Tulosesus angulatus]
MTARASSSTLPRPDIPHNAPRRSVSSRPRLPELDEALAAFRKALPRPKDTVTGKARTTTWANREDEPFMLYRDPPPWAALDEAKCTMRSEEERRRKQVKSNIAMRQCDVAKVELSGGKAAAVKQQLENLLAKRRTQMREDFGLESKPRTLTTAPSQPKSNPFGRRPDVAPKPTFTAPPTPTLSASSSRELIPISRVRTPMFTQELLDVSSKENEKALKAGSEGIDPPAKRQKRSSLPSSTSKSKQPQTLAPEKSGSTVDLRKWFTKKA